MSDQTCVQSWQIYMIHKELISGWDDGPLSLSEADTLSADRQDQMELTRLGVLRYGVGDSMGFVVIHLTELLPVHIQKKQQWL